MMGERKLAFSLASAGLRHSLDAIAALIEYPTNPDIAPTLWFAFSFFTRRFDCGSGESISGIAYLRKLESKLIQANTRAEFPATKHGSNHKAGLILAKNFLKQIIEIWDPECRKAGDELASQFLFAMAKDDAQWMQTNEAQEMHDKVENELNSGFVPHAEFLPDKLEAIRHWLGSQYLRQDEASQLSANILREFGHLEEADFANIEFANATQEAPKQNGKDRKGIGGRNPKVFKPWEAYVLDCYSKGTRRTAELAALAIKKYYSDASEISVESIRTLINTASHREKNPKEDHPKRRKN